MNCQSKNRNGGQCRARALTGNESCAMHAEPGRAAFLGSKGGRRRAVYKPESLMRFEAPRTAADLRDLFAQSIVEIRTGELDPKSANAIAYLGTGFLRALEIADLEARLANLERVMDAGKPRMEIGNIGVASNDRLEESR
jgi:hypothetical protein